MKKLLVFFTLVLATGIVSAQKIIIEEGSFVNVKGSAKFNVQYKYDNMGIGGYSNEKYYIEKKREELNKKEAGRGDKWAESWISDRADKFQVKFASLFQEHSNGIVLAENDKSAPYTLILQTTYTEPGFNVGVLRKDASINAIAYIVETANPDNILTKISIMKAPGRDVWGVDFATGPRLAEAYAMAGKALGKFYVKNTK